MSLVSFQSDIRDALLAAASPGPGASAAQLAVAAQLAGLEIMLELDETATAAQLDAQEGIFEREISLKGFVIVISTPRAESISAVEGRPVAGAVHLRMVCQIGFIESPRINRAAVDPSQPAIVPAGKRPLAVIIAAMQVLLGAGCEFPAAPLTAPEQDLEGLNLHGLLVTEKHVVRAL